MVWTSDALKAGLSPLSLSRMLRYPDVFKACALLHCSLFAFLAEFAIHRKRHYDLILA